MPAWIHERAEHIRRKNPSMPEGEAFAIATQQSYAAGKAPKSYGTQEGRHAAREKYDDPKDGYVKTPDPKTKTSSREMALLMGFSDELQKIAMSTTSSVMSSATKTTAPKNLPKPVMARMPNPVSVPREAGSSVPQADHLASSRMIQPPPITSGGL